MSTRLRYMLDLPHDSGIRYLGAIAKAQVLGWRTSAELGRPPSLQMLMAVMQRVGAASGWRLRIWREPRRVRRSRSQYRQELGAPMERPQPTRGRPARIQRVVAVPTAPDDSPAIRFTYGDTASLYSQLQQARTQAFQQPAPTQTPAPAQTRPSNWSNPNFEEWVTNEEHDV